MRIYIQTLVFYLLVTQICFAQWVQVGLNEESIKDIAVQNSNIFAVTSNNGKLFRSTDNGANWTMIVDSCARDVEISLTGKVFMVIDSSLNYNFWDPHSLISSMDNGVTWAQVNILEQIQDSIPSGVGITRVYNGITISPTGSVFCNISYNLYRTMNQDCIALSDDDGITWSTPGMGVIGGRLFDFKDQSWITIGRESGRYGGTYEHLNLSNDDGNTWNYLGWVQGTSSEMAYVKVIGFFSNDNIITGGIEYDSTGTPTIPAIMLSTDMCSTWTKISSLNSQVGLSYSSGSEEGMLIGTDSLGVFLFSDEGDSLGSRNEGLTNLNIQALTLDNNGYVYTGTENGVWRRPLSEITSVEEQEIDEIPTEFLLSQNFPNPFNPNTKIKYSVPTSSQVTIKIFNTLGEELETLVNEEKSAGSYEIIWTSKQLPSGVYLYQLKAGNYINTKKMILLK